MTAVETALVMMIALVFIFGIVEGSRALWDWNRAHKATQMGARFAIVNDMVAENLADWSGIDNGISGGDPIPIGAVTPMPVLCDENSCDNQWGHDQLAFNAILTRMQQGFDRIQPEDVRIIYDHVGLGFSGNPEGPDVAPAVTIRLTGMTFDFITPIFGDVDWSMPDIEATLTAEDSTTPDAP